MNNGPLAIFPVTGFMDARSMPDEVPFGGYRLAQNWHVTQKNRLERMTGFEKFLTRDTYNNQDLHDQLTEDPWQPVQTVYGARLNSGFSKVFAATQNRIYALNMASGNWQKFAACLGGPVPCRDPYEPDITCISWPDYTWSMAHVENVLVLTNDLDKPQYHVIDQGLSEPGCGTQVAASRPMLNYAGFADWDVTAGHVDLIGMGSTGESIVDLLEGNGLYLDLSGSSAAWLGTIRTKESFTFTTGHTYRVTIEVAGNQRWNAAGFTVSVGLDTSTSEQDWLETVYNSDFAAVSFDFAGDNASHKVYVRQKALGAGAPSYYGNLLKSVTITDVTEAVVLASYDFQAENATGVTTAEAQQGVAPIPDFEPGRLSVSRVRLVYAWQNLMFYGNVEQDGERRANRIIWSDYKRPLSIYPSNASVAGYHDLPSGEVILGILALQDSLLFYTNLGIWELRIASQTAGDGSVAFVPAIRKRYVPDEAGSRCIAYPRTLISDGSSHYYMGKDGIYRYDMGTTVPKLEPYIHAASSLIFDTMDTARCSVHCAGYYPKYRQLKFSWAVAGDILPSKTLVIGTEFPFTSIEDHGYTAFSNVEPSSNSTIRDFLTGLCLCTEAELEELGFGFEAEGGYCTTPAQPSCTERPSVLRTATVKTVDGVDVEDWTATPAADSVCWTSGSLKVSDLCGQEFAAGQCNPAELFVQASAADFCLKQAADVYYREMCTGFSTCGTYSLDGYQSRLLSGALHFQAPHAYKVLGKFMVEAQAALVTPGEEPGAFTLRIGTAAQAIEPVNASGRCQIAWADAGSLALQCLAEDTAEVNAAANIMPDLQYDWALYNRGFYIYFDLVVENPNVDPADTGASVSISRMQLDVVRQS